MDRYENDRLKHLYLTGLTPTGKAMGDGAYGTVFEVQFCGTLYAAKQIHSVLIEGVEREGFRRMKRMFIEECLQSSALGHQNVVSVLGVYDPGHQSLLPVLVMERMQESLTLLVERYPNIPLYVKFSILLDVSRGLWYLHNHQPPIAHRDLSPNNVLLTEQFVAKISDLGVAKVIRADSRKTKTRAPGTVDFMPPEALQEIPEYNTPLDVFSYGGIMLHTINQEWPKPLHYVMTDPKTGKRVALSEVQRRQEHINKLSITGIPEDLVEQCLDDNPHRRPPISEVSERMTRMKEAEHERSPYINMDPISWYIDHTTKMLEVMVTPTAKVQQQLDMVKVKWKEVAPLPVARAAHTAVLLQGSVYVGSGYEGPNDMERKDCYRLDIYNLLANQWSSITAPCCWFAMTVLHDKLIIAGGKTRSDEALKRIFVLNAGQWKNYSEMPTARLSPVAVGYQSKLIVAGGAILVQDEWIKLATTEILDTISGCWYICNSLPSPHFQLKATIVNNTLYLLGGSNRDGDPSPQVFSAALAADYPLKWQSLPRSSRCYFASVVLYSKHLLTLGGRLQYDTASQCCKIHTLDSLTGSWRQVKNLNIPAARSLAAAVGLTDNEVMLIGGGTNQGNYSTNVWIGVFQETNPCHLATNFIYSYV